MLVSAFITHKKAERFSDCQDRFSVKPGTKSIAVSDGMSQSIFQKYWAQILADKYTETADWVPNLESVRELSPSWDARVSRYLEEEEQAGRNPWRAKGSIARGLSAGATILGVRFVNGEWFCDVLGDSCFILVRDNHIEQLLTSEDVVAFGNYPDYYDSNPQKTGKGVLKSESGKLLQGDVILLVSDPFSDYLLKNRGTAKESVLVNRLVGINSHAEFEAVVAEWREQGMHNDDSTLVIIKQDKSEDLNLIEGCIDDIEELIANEKTPQEESFDSKEVEGTSTTPTPDNSSVQKEQPDQNVIQILLSQFKDPKFKKHLETAIKESVKKYMSKRGGLDKRIYKRISNLCDDLIEAISDFFKK